MEENKEKWKKYDMSPVQVIATTIAIILLIVGGIILNLNVVQLFGSAIILFLILRFIFKVRFIPAGGVGGSRWLTEHPEENPNLHEK